MQDSSSLGRRRSFAFWACLQMLDFPEKSSVFGTSIAFLGDFLDRPNQSGTKSPHTLVTRQQLSAMGSDPGVVDISSDEESSWDVDSPIDWLSELLDDVNEENEESDDVVVVDELSCASVQKQSCAPSNGVKETLENGSDDECLVLDGDPDKPAAVEDDKGYGSDDILVVGEKGQVQILFVALPSSFVALPSSFVIVVFSWALGPVILVCIALANLSYA
ncbi:hypothetical protein ACLOJK_007761 [Asimina triloba]